jgi:aromatic ring-cleaving dioxygenase
MGRALRRLWDKLGCGKLHVETWGIEMDKTPREISEIASYHAHVYFHPTSSQGEAEALRAQIAQRFPVQLGRWHEVPVGPHPSAMYQIAFDKKLFATLVPWLMLNRRTLTVLVHPNTDNPHDDHLLHALWMGERLELDASRLPHSLRDSGKGA